MSSCSIYRDGLHHQTLKEVVSYAQQQKCFFVLDHCNFLALTEGEEFLKVVEEQIKRDLTPGSKLIMIFDSDERLKPLYAGRYYTFEYKLTDEEQISIFADLRNIPEYKNQSWKWIGEEDRIHVKNIHQELRSWLPHNIKTYKALGLDDRTARDPPKFYKHIEQAKK